jgi:thioredoxin-related protein
MRQLWLKIGVIISTIFIFTACSNSKENGTTKKEVSIEKKDVYGIPWEKDLKTAFLRARSENKNVIIMAVSVGCGWCKKMKERTLSNPEVAKRLEKYILVQADRETPTERDQLPPFKHVPILFFMTPDKEVIDNMRGYYLAEDFLEYLNEIEEI